LRAYNSINVPGGIGNTLNTTLTSAHTPVPIPLLGPGLNFTTWSEFESDDANSLFRLWHNDYFRIYGVFGVKFVNLEEDVSFLYSVVDPASLWFDEFHTRNEFWGANLGLQMMFTSGIWNLDVALKCGLGVNYAAISVFGSNTSAAASNTQILTNDANIGYWESSLFSVAPEVNVNLSCQVAPRILLRAGYTFLAFTNVARPGEQIVQNLDPATTAGMHNQPVLPFRTTTFMIHGVNLGAIVRY
jgi:hypothetical protein